MFVNHTTKLVIAKIVYYGPGLSGKTSNLQYVFSITNPKARGELVSIETETERTFFFDLLPMNVGLIKSYEAKFQLYTVPGQLFYNATRRMVLKGADGIVFVADSQRIREDANIESFRNLETNLRENNLDLEEIPLVIQYNKRDLENVLPIEQMNRAVNKDQWPFYEAVATGGKGVIETLREISSLTLKKIKQTIELNEQKNSLVRRPVIDFAFNQDTDIINRDELPFKKIAVEKVEDMDAELTQQSRKELLPEEDETDTLPDQTSREEFIHHSPTEHRKEESPAEKEPGDTVEKEKKEQIFNKKTESIKKELGVDILESLGDKTRMTILKKLQLNDRVLTLEIRDSKGEKLDCFDLDIGPEIKKLTVIFDVKK